MNTISQTLRPAEYEYHQSGTPVLVRSIFYLLFIRESMVFAIDSFLNNLLFCLHWQDHQIEKPTELAEG